MVFAELLALLRDLPALIGLWKSLRSQFGDNVGKVIIRTDEMWSKMKSVDSEAAAFEAAKAIQSVIGKL